MALITEDGSGRADAESFCSVAYADAYHAGRGNTDWATLSTEEKEQALRRGTDYLEQAYALRLNGYRQFTTQALAWPRYEVKRQGGVCGEYWPVNTVPDPIAKACAEMAFRAAKCELAPDIGQVIKSESFPGLKTEYMDSNGVIRYRQIDQIMAQFLSGSGNSISLVRS